MIKMIDRLLFFAMGYLQWMDMEKGIPGASWLYWKLYDLRDWIKGDKDKVIDDIPF